MPYAQATRARIRQARPRTGMGAWLGRALAVGELRRALRHQRVALADEARALLAHRDDHLAAGAERVGHRSGVADRHRGTPGAVAHAEVERVAPPDVAGGHLAGELVGAARLRARHELAGRLGGARRAEARVDEG